VLLVPFLQTTDLSKSQGLAHGSFKTRQSVHKPTS
jgi:hypothetical protein